MIGLKNREFAFITGLFINAVEADLIRKIPFRFWKSLNVYEKSSVLLSLLSEVKVVKA